MMLNLHNLPPLSSRLLVAVSGGRDSVALLHALIQKGYTCAIVHVNHQLRGEQSDADERLVRQLAKEWHLAVFIKKCATADVIQHQSGSLQEVARDQRYHYFQQIAKEHRFDWIITAHHAGDQMETVMIHLLRGTGLKGLCGIPAQRDNICRPMLATTREKIDQYIAFHDLHYRDDATNWTKKYRRNEIRHDLIPVIEKLQPNFSHILRNSIQRWKEQYYVYRMGIDSLKEKFWQEDSPGTARISTELLAHPAAATLLHEYLLAYGFTDAQLANLLESPHPRTGAQWNSSSHRLLMDRLHLLLSPIPAVDHSSHYIICQGQTTAKTPFGTLSIRLEKAPEKFDTSNTEIWMRADALQFPLHLRRWQAGDVFRPFGMAGKSKKIQDFFTDQKLSRWEKERTMLLCDAADQILWVIPFRASEETRLNMHDELAYHLSWE